jgi:hypothetical protein
VLAATKGGSERPGRAAAPAAGAGSETAMTDMPPPQAGSRPGAAAAGRSRQSTRPVAIAPRARPLESAANQPSSAQLRRQSPQAQTPSRHLRRNRRRWRRAISAGARRGSAAAQCATAGEPRTAQSGSQRAIAQATARSPQI